MSEQSVSPIATGIPLNLSPAEPAALSPQLSLSHASSLSSTGAAGQFADILSNPPRILPPHTSVSELNVSATPSQEPPPISLTGASLPATTEQSPGEQFLDILYRKPGNYAAEIRQLAHTISPTLELQLSDTLRHLAEAERRGNHSDVIRHLYVAANSFGFQPHAAVYEYLAAKVLRHEGLIGDRLVAPEHALRGPHDSEVREHAQIQRDILVKQAGGLANYGLSTQIGQLVDQLMAERSQRFLTTRAELAVTDYLGAQFQRQGQDPEAFLDYLQGLVNPQTEHQLRDRQSFDYVTFTTGQTEPGLAWARLANTHNGFVRDLFGSKEGYQTWVGIVSRILPTSEDLRNGLVLAITDAEANVQGVADATAGFWEFLTTSEGRELAAAIPTMLDTIEADAARLAGSSAYGRGAKLGILLDVLMTVFTAADSADDLLHLTRLSRHPGRTRGELLTGLDDLVKTLDNPVTQHKAAGLLDELRHADARGYSFWWRQDGDITNLIDEVDRFLDDVGPGYVPPQSVEVETRHGWQRVGPADEVVPPAGLVPAPSTGVPELGLPLNTQTALPSSASISLPANVLAADPAALQSIMKPLSQALFPQSPVIAQSLEFILSRAVIEDFLAARGERVTTSADIMAFAQEELSQADTLKSLNSRVIEHVIDNIIQPFHPTLQPFLRQRLQQALHDNWSQITRGDGRDWRRLGSFLDGIVQNRPVDLANGGQEGQLTIYLNEAFSQMETAYVDSQLLPWLEEGLGTVIPRERVLQILHRMYGDLPVAERPEFLLDLPSRPADVARLIRHVSDNNIMPFHNESPPAVAVAAPDNNPLPGVSGDVIFSFASNGNFVLGDTPGDVNTAANAGTMGSSEVPDNPLNINGQEGDPPDPVNNNNEPSANEPNNANAIPMGGPDDANPAQSLADRIQAADNNFGGQKHWVVTRDHVFVNPDLLEDNADTIIRMYIPYSPSSLSQTTLNAAIQSGVPIETPRDAFDILINKYGQEMTQQLFQALVIGHDGAHPGIDGVISYLDSVDPTNNISFSLLDGYRLQQLANNMNQTPHDSAHIAAGYGISIMHEVWWNGFAKVQNIASYFFYDPPKLDPNIPLIQQGNAKEALSEMITTEYLRFMDREERLHGVGYSAIETSYESATRQMINTSTPANRNMRTANEWVDAVMADLDERNEINHLSDAQRIEIIAILQAHKIEVISSGNRLADNSRQIIESIAYIINDAAFDIGHAQMNADQFLDRAINSIAMSVLAAQNGFDSSDEYLSESMPIAYWTHINPDFTQNLDMRTAFPSMVQEIRDILGPDFSLNNINSPAQRPPD